MVAEFWGLLVIVAAAVAQEPLNEAELSRHLTVVRTQIADVTIDPLRREQLALDMAATLDRAAQSVTDPDVRRRRWALAIELLDRFSKEYPDLPLARQLRFQAAVFRWAQAQTWLHARAGGARRFPVSRASHCPGRRRDRALAPVSSIGDQTTLGENLRFRLAQALADRAELDPADSADRRTHENEAKNLLQPPATEVGLAGFWHLLEADLARAEREIPHGLRSSSRKRPRPSPLLRNATDSMSRFRCGSVRISSPRPSRRSTARTWTPR